MKTSVESNSRSRKDILRWIVADHDLLRDSIEVLTSEEQDIADKIEHLEKFLLQLQIHSKAEEASLYDSLLSINQLRAAILESNEEHIIAKNLSLEIEALKRSQTWSEKIEVKAKVLAELMKHHIDQEEEELFPEVRSLLSKDELENLGVIYLQTRKDIIVELEERPEIPSYELFAETLHGAWKGTARRVSSYVSSKLNLSH